MPPAPSEINTEHLERVRAWYDGAPTTLKWASIGYRRMLAHYYGLLIPVDASVLEIGCGTGELLARLHARRKVGIDLSEKQVEAARKRAPDCEFIVQAAESLQLDERFDCIIISDTLNFAADVQRALERLHSVSHPGTRLIVNYPSALWRPAFALARGLGLKSGAPQSNWLTTADVRSLMELADWSAVTRQSRLICPVRALGIGSFLSRWLAPILPFFCVTVFCVARSVRNKEPGPLTVSVVIPA